MINPHSNTVTPQMKHQRTHSLHSQITRNTNLRIKPTTNINAITLMTRQTQVKRIPSLNPTRLNSRHSLLHTRRISRRLNHNRLPLHRLITIPTTSRNTKQRIPRLTSRTISQLQSRIIRQQRHNRRRLSIIRLRQSIITMQGLTLRHSQNLSTSHNIRQRTMRTRILQMLSRMTTTIHVTIHRQSTQRRQRTTIMIRRMRPRLNITRPQNRMPHHSTRLPTQLQRRITFTQRNKATKHHPRRKIHISSQSITLTATMTRIPRRIQITSQHQHNSRTRRRRNHTINHRIINQRRTTHQINLSLLRLRRMRNFSQRILNRIRHTMRRISQRRHLTRLQTNTTRPHSINQISRTSTIHSRHILTPISSLLTRTRQNQRITRNRITRRRNVRGPRTTTSLLITHSLQRRPHIHILRIMRMTHTRRTTPLIITISQRFQDSTRHVQRSITTIQMIRQTPIKISQRPPKHHTLSLIRLNRQRQQATHQHRIRRKISTNLTNRINNHVLHTRQSTMKRHNISNPNPTITRLRISNISQNNHGPTNRNRNSYNTRSLQTTHQIQNQAGHILIRIITLLIPNLAT